MSVADIATLGALAAFAIWTQWQKSSDRRAAEKLREVEQVERNKQNELLVQASRKLESDKAAVKEYLEQEARKREKEAAEVKDALLVATEDQDKKLAVLHVLANSGQLKLKEKLSDALSALAQATGDPKHKAEAEEAKREFEEHQSKQDQLDAVALNEVKKLEEKENE